MDSRYLFGLSIAAAFAAGPTLSSAQSAAQPGAEVVSSQDILGDIVVTAQRRAERLQDVPMAVSAFSASTLEHANVEGVTDLKTVVPAFNAEGSFGTVVPFLRGVGNPAVIVGNEASVPIYVDGIYISRLQPTFFEFNDIERVEVLKGPQGTLFGRNSTGGLVQIITRDPTNEPTINGSLGYGTYQTVKAKLYASAGSGPIAGNFALMYVNQGEGWGRNITTGQETFKERSIGMHTKWIFQISDASSFTLAGDFTDSTSSIGMVQGAYRGVVQGDPANPGAALPGLGFYDSRVEHPIANIVHGGGGSLQYDLDLSIGHLKNIAAYRETHGSVAIDADFTAAPIYEADEPYLVTQLSEELQLASLPSSTIKWLVGAYYLHLNSAYIPTTLTGSAFVPPGLSVNLWGQQIGDSYAMYGQTTFPVAAQTDLTLGTRYTVDDISGNGHTDVAQLGGSVLIPGTPLGASTSFDKLTYRVDLDHHFTGSILGYASASRGFKAGIYNLQPFDGTPVQPEVIDAGEIGVKTELFDHALRLNGALFYNYITDPQVERDVGSGVALINAKSAVTKGLDVDGDAEPIKNLTIRFGFTWMSALYKSFADAPYYYPNPSPPYGNQPAVVSLSADGARMPRAPSFAYSIGADYRIPASVGEFTLGANYWHTSAFYWTPDNINAEPSYGLLGAHLGYKPNDAHWGVRLEGRNLTGSKYYTTLNQLTGIAGTVGAPGFPRTANLTVDFHF